MGLCITINVCVYRDVIITQDQHIKTVRYTQRTELQPESSSEHTFS